MTSLFRHIRQSVTLFFLAVLCFCAGSAIAQISTTAPPQIVPVSAGNEGNWGLSFQQEGKPPVANASADYLKQFHAYYAAQTAEKVLYLTFDAGYENGNTPVILDALEKASGTCCFFSGGKLSGDQPGSGKKNGGRRTYRGQPYLSSPGYVQNLHQRNIFKRIKRSGNAVYKNHRPVHDPLLSPSPGQVQ